MNAFTRIAYDHFGTALLVSGERDQFECVVERITASDSSIDLFDMLPPSTVQTISDRIDRQLSAEARQHNVEAHHDRVMADPMRYWLTA